MEREILFRGKRTDNGKWVEGHLIVFPKSKITKIMVWNAADLDFDAIEVRPETVGQFTGLNDRNGKRIFEGDIIRDDWGKIFKVIFSTTSCGFMVECTVAPNEYEKGKYRLGDAWCNTIAVVGNIHDNPELLNGTES